MGKCREKTELPFYIRRIVSRYKPYLRDRISYAISAKMLELGNVGQAVTSKDIFECVGDAIGEIASAPRNKRMEDLSWDAMLSGDYVPLKDVINELRARIANPDPGTVPLKPHS